MWMCHVAQKIFMLMYCLCQVLWLVSSSKDLSELLWVVEVAKTITFSPHFRYEDVPFSCLPIVPELYRWLYFTGFKSLCYFGWGFVFFSQLSVMPGHYKSVRCSYKSSRYSFNRMIYIISCTHLCMTCSRFVGIGLNLSCAPISEKISHQMLMNLWCNFDVIGERQAEKWCLWLWTCGAWGETSPVMRSAWDLRWG